MTNHDLERRIAQALHRQAERADLYFDESGLASRMVAESGRARIHPSWVTGGLAAAAVLGAIAVGLWASGLFPRSDLGSLPTPSQSPTAAPSPTAPASAEPSATPTPASPPSPSATPDGLVGSTAEVVGGELLAYTEPVTDATIADRVAEGRVVWVDSVQRSDGEKWLRIQFASFAWNGQEIFAWTPALQQLREVTLTCPDPPDVAALGAMAAPEHLRCFGSNELTVVGFAAHLEPVEQAYVGTPAWIAEPSTLVLRGSDSPATDTGLLALHVDPNSGIAVPHDAWVEVTGHFDDPAAGDCRRRRTADALSVESSSEQRLYCRQRFVVTGLRVVDPPSFPTPGS